MALSDRGNSLAKTEENKDSQGTRVKAGPNEHNSEQSRYNVQTDIWSIKFAL